MRSTHACTPSFAHFFSQYSRRLLSILARPKRKQQKTKQHRSLQRIFDLVFVEDYLLFYKTNLIKERSEKKNAEHTRMYTNFRSFSSQYSRRLLSILARQHLNYKKNNYSVVEATTLLTDNATVQQQVS